MFVFTVCLWTVYDCWHKSLRIVQGILYFSPVRSI